MLIDVFIGDGSDRLLAQLLAAQERLAALEAAADLEWAKAYCAERGWQYLSHETYQTMTTHEVWIAAASGCERFEVKCKK